MGLFDLFSSSDGKRAAANARDARIAGARTGEDRASGYLDKGLNAATDYYTGASKLFDQWANTGRDANAMYGNALGLGGQEGHDAAVGAFRTGPGYEFAVESGLDAVDRRAASRGMLGSGNTNLDSIRFSQGLADQEYQRWLDNLNTASGTGLQATGSQANIQTGLGDLNYKTGAAKGDLAYRTETGVGDANAQFQADRYAADQAAGANVWNAIMGVGNLASSFFGGRSATPPAPTGGDVGTRDWYPAVFRS